MVRLETNAKSMSLCHTLGCLGTSMEKLMPLNEIENTQTIETNIYTIFQNCLTKLLGMALSKITSDSGSHLWCWLCIVGNSHLCSLQANVWLYSYPCSLGQASMGHGEVVCSNWVCPGYAPPHHHISPAKTDGLFPSRIGNSRTLWDVPRIKRAMVFPISCSMSQSLKPTFSNSNHKHEAPTTNRGPADLPVPGSTTGADIEDVLHQLEDLGRDAQHGIYLWCDMDRNFET